jgi:hypothetical protein
VTVEAAVVPAMDELRRAVDPPGYLCDRDSSVQPSRNAGVSQVVDEFAGGPLRSRNNSLSDIHI